MSTSYGVILLRHERRRAERARSARRCSRRALVVPVAARTTRAPRRRRRSWRQPTSSRLRIRPLKVKFALPIPTEPPEDVRLGVQEAVTASTASRSRRSLRRGGARGTRSAPSTRSASSRSDEPGGLGLAAESRHAPAPRCSRPRASASSASSSWSLPSSSRNSPTPLEGVTDCRPHRRGEVAGGNVQASGVVARSRDAADRRRRARSLSE